VGLKTAKYALLCMACAAAAGICRVGNSSDEGSAPRFVDGMMCGPECLWLAAHRYGKHVSLETLMRMAHTDPRTGTTVRNMLNVCRELGLSAECVETDLDSLLADSRQDILLVLNNTHFILLVGADAEKVYLVDEARREEMDRVTFARYWGGLAIAVGEGRCADARWFTLALLVPAGLAAITWAVLCFQSRLSGLRRKSRHERIDASGASILSRERLT